MNMNETINEAADTAAKKAQPLVDRVKSMAYDATDKASTMKDEAKDWLASQGEQLSARQKQAVDSTANYISANPFKSIGIAALAALVIGRLMR
ncbi:MAG: hypothetical protein ABI630_03590 [Betaproteobacteria bacterium]